METTKKLKFVVLTIIGIASVVFLAQFVNNYVFKSKAAGGSVAISIDPASGTINQSEKVFLILKGNEGSKISGFDISFSTSGAVSVDHATTPTAVGLPNLTPFTQLISTQERVSYVAIKGDAELPNTISLPVVINCTSAGSGSLTINTTKSQVVGSVQGGVFDFGLVGTASFDCVEGAPSSGGSSAIQARFEPEDQSQNVGDTFSYKLKLDGNSFTGGAQISGWDVEIKVGNEVDVSSIGEPTFTDIQTVAPSTNTTGGGGGSSDSVISPTPLPPTILPTDLPATPSPADEAGLNCTKLIKSWNKETRKIRLAYACISKNLPNQVITLLTLKGVKEGQGSLQITSTQVVGNVAGGEFTVDKKNATYTIGTGGSTDEGQGNIKLNMALKFQGVVSKPNRTEPITVKIGLGGGTLQAPKFKTTAFTPDDNGLWHGTVSFAVAAGSNYKILVKGPLHLQKKICDSQPKETFPGTYGCDRGHITLNDGDNSLDFSGIYLLVGDLPDQDGITNSYDISLVRNLLGKTDAESLKSADLNYDGAVNAQDYSLVIAALSVRNDEQ